MDKSNVNLTHVAGTFVIQADGAFLNGAGIDPRREDKNTTVPKSYRDGVGNRVPYVSAQAWRHWLRSTLTEETGWPPSELRAIDLSEKGTTNKIAGELNPVEFPEDDIFGYMRTAKGQGREGSSDSEDEDKSEEELKRDQEVKFFKDTSNEIKAVQTGKQGRGKKAKNLSEDERVEAARRVVKRLQDEAEKRLSEDEEAIEKAVQDRLQSINELLNAAKGKSNFNSLSQEMNNIAQAFNPGRIRSLMRSSPFAASLLFSIRRKGWEGLDKGFVHLKEGTPLPYNTEFYNTHLQGIFCLDYGRLGVFWNIGDRIELDENKVEKFLKAEQIRIVRDEGKLGKVYEMSNAKVKRKERAAALFKALAVLRGGAKQAQFGTDIAPKVLILAGLACGNPIFNHLFKDDNEGPVLKIEAFKEVIQDYADRIASPVLLGIRAGYLKNEQEVRGLEGWYKVKRKKIDTAMTEMEGPFQREKKEEDEEEGKWIEIKLMTPVEAARSMGELLP